MHRSLPLLATGLLLALPASAGHAPPRSVLVPSLVEFLGAEPAECADVAPALASDPAATCVRVASTWKQLKKKVRSFLKQQESDDALSDLPWTTPQPYRTRYVSTADGMLRLVHDEEGGWLVLVPGHPCFDREKLESMGVRVPDGESVSFPEIRHRESAEYPEDARRERASGSVVLDLLVREDGSVADVCVLVESRHGFGFGASAARAMSRSLFEPATAGGRPVPVTWTTTVTFEIR